MKEDRPARRRWFQFRLRALLILLLFVSLALNWVLSQRQRAREQRELVNALIEIEWGFPSIVYDWQQQLDRNGLPRTAPRGPKWLRDRIGDEYFQRIVEFDLDQPNVCFSVIPVVGTNDDSVALRGNVLATVDPVEEIDEHEQELLHYVLSRAGKMKSIRTMGLGRPDVVDEMLVHLKDLDRLEELRLDRAEFTGEGIRFLKNMKRLKHLTLSQTDVSDAALIHVRVLTGLETLNLSETKITGRRLHYLSSLRNLKVLDLSDNSLVELNGLIALENLEKLDVGYINFHEVDDQEVDCQFLASMRNLKSLQLDGFQCLDMEEVFGHISKMAELTELDLNRTSIYDASVLHQLTQLEELTRLGLWSANGIDDSAVDHLVQMTQLREVLIHSTQITTDGVKRLCEALPNLDVCGFEGVPAIVYSDPFGTDSTDSQ